MNLPDDPFQRISFPSDYWREAIIAEMSIIIIIIFPNMSFFTSLFSAGCKYVQVSDWSSCDNATKTSTRTLELAFGDSKTCDNNTVESRQCDGKDVKGKNGKRDKDSRKKKKLSRKERRRKKSRKKRKRLRSKQRKRKKNKQKTNSGTYDYEVHLDMGKKYLLCV